MSPALARIANRLRGRRDTEHEQAIVRFVLGAVVGYYLLYTALRDGVLSAPERATLWILAGFFACAAAIFALIVARPAPSIPRRYVALALDVGTATAVIAVNGEHAAPVFPVYLWITFGYGLRYGQRALAAAATLSVVGFAAVIHATDFGNLGPKVAYGFLVGLIVPPLYVSFLLAKLTDALRRAQAADEAKSRFLSNVSHEVRTPLHGILGITEVLLDSQLPPEQRRSVVLLHRSATWLLEVLEAVLEFSRMRSGRAALEESDFDLPGALESLAEFYREIAGPDGPRVEIRVGEDVPRAVRADRVKLLQVLQNLLRNAVKFTPAGTVTIEATAAGESAGRRLLRFIVADTGVGIPAEERARIFEPFAQAGSEAGAPPRGGVGLGLAIARDLVALLGGEIGLESEPGRGTTVSFVVPVAAGDERALAAATPPAGPALPPSPAWRARPRILVADDNAISREVFAKLLDRFGCTAVFVASGLAAVEAVSRERFDLVLMDCQMPEMDGYAAAQEIRRRLPQEALPIVAVTAYESEEHRNRCLEAGMDDVVAKPFRAAELLEVITRWLSSHLAPPGMEAQALPRPDDLIGAGMPTGGIAPRAAVHEINNALTGLLGYADLLAMGLGHDPRLKGYADRILEAGERARQILLAMPRG